MHIMLLPLAFLAGGFARRVAGGVLSDWIGWQAPGVPARLFYGATIGALAWGGGAVWWFALILALNVWIGHIARGLWGAASMGRRGPDNATFTWAAFARDWLCMWAYGLGQVFVAAALAVWIAHSWWTPGLGPIWDAGRAADYRWLPLVLAGAFAPVAYAVSWAMWSRRWLKAVPGVSEDPLQHAEWLFGGAMGVGAWMCVG